MMLTALTLDEKMDRFRLVPILSDTCYVHQLRSELMDEGAESDATFPGRRQVCNHHIPVALRLLLAPGEKPRRSNL